MSLLGERFSLAAGNDPPKARTSHALALPHAGDGLWLCRGGVVWFGTVQRVHWRGYPTLMGTNVCTDAARGQILYKRRCSH